MKLSPFLYPASPHARRHGPAGYSTYSHYRPWLRDEFNFRCVYCLRREVWSFDNSDYELDHDVAQSLAPELCRDYTNLVYSCHNCNKRKGSKRLPSPMDIAYGAAMRVLTSGRHIGKIEAMNADGFRLIEELALDAVKITETRKLFIETIRSFESMANPLLFQWMGFPKDIPDLANVHPAPKSNSKPKGIEQSWFALKTRGRLPLFYE